MNAATSKSKELFNKAKQLIPGGVNSPVRAFNSVGGTPIYYKSASGSTFTDIDENTYVDFCQSWGPLILGHARPEVVEAVQQAALGGLSYGACHEKEIEIAELVLEAFPEFEKVRFVNSGTEAVMTALRVARGKTGRDLVLKFDGGYHGHFDGMLVRAGSGLATHAIASSQGVPEQIAATTLVSALDDEQTVTELFEKHGDKIAAVIIEPLPANNGLLVQRQGFLQFLRDITEKFGALLIFDEVISGFRLRYGGYMHEASITPDLITLGKIIGGGMPVGALMGSSAAMNVLSPIGSVYQAGTLSGNPVSLAAGIATLKLLRDNPPYGELDRLAKMFVEALSGSGLSYARAVQVGSVLWLYLAEGEFPRRSDAIDDVSSQRYNRIYGNLLQKGYYLAPSALEVLFLSSAHSEDQVQGLAKAILSELMGLDHG
ncbi:glutamate-1-semialdehyde 2,1-aminomutase [Thermodesulfobacteriota bacterium]